MSQLDRDSETGGGRLQLVYLDSESVYLYQFTLPSDTNSDRPKYVRVQYDGLLCH